MFEGIINHVAVAVLALAVSLREEHVPVSASPPFETAVARLLALAGTIDDPGHRDRVVAHAARLLARAGRGEEAMALAEARLATPRAEWDGAAVYAEVALREATAGKLDGAGAAIRRGLARARATPMAEGGDDTRLEDLLAALVETGDPRLTRIAAEMVPADDQAVLLESVIEDALMRGDLDGALAAHAAWPADEGVPSLVISICRLAVDHGRPEVARRFAPTLGGYMAQYAVDVLLDAGAPDEAAAVLDDLEPGWARAEALAMAARHAGLHGDGAAFEGWSARAIAEIAGFGASAHQPLGRMAEGAAALLGREGALRWAAGRLPESQHVPFAAKVANPDGTTTWNDPDARAGQACRDLIDQHLWEEAIAALDGFTNPYLAIDHARRIGEAAGAAGPAAGDAALRALVAGLDRLSATFADGGGRYFAKESLRFVMARWLGLAAGRLLDERERAVFIEAAFENAAVLPPVMAAIQIIAAGFATL